MVIKVANPAGLVTISLMNLFQQARQPQIAKESPLANRMRPRSLEEYVGQEHIIGPGRLLRRAIQADQLSSLIFYGPPGTGKTTLAMVIANTTRSHFIIINAVLAGVKEIREAIETAQERRQLYNQRTTLFVDEVHRWNKAQQDALLPHVENGMIILIGATTENPYFEVNKALVSRSRIFQLKPLTISDLRRVAWQALADSERGYGRLAVELDPEALDHLVDVANGDARGVLNALELAVETTPPDDSGRILIDLTVAEESIQRRAVLYDKDGDAHYDTISAFIKSLRGSDPDAALYWMAKMIYAGEDPRFIFRRMAILAGEDVGLADPQAMTVVTSCWEAFERIGLPEGRFHLTVATLYLATCPKSNSALAFFDALAAIEKEQESEVPTHLRDGSRDKEGFGHGQGYLYPHAYRDHWVAQQYLPAGLQGKLFYQPSDQGYERAIAEEVARKREAQLAVMMEPAGPEVLSNSPQNRGRDLWLQRAISDSGRKFAQLRQRLFELAAVQRHHLLLDLTAGSGLLMWEGVRRTPEGGVWALAEPEAGDILRQQASKLAELERPTVLIGTISDLPRLLELRGQGAVRFDRVLARNPFSGLTSRLELLRPVAGWLGRGGLFCFAQVVGRRGQRLYELINWQEAPAGLFEQVQVAEEAIYHDPHNPLVNWDVAELEIELQSVGFQKPTIQLESQSESRQITAAHFERWFGADGLGSYGGQLGLPAGELSQLLALYRRELLDKVVNWQATTLFCVATISGNIP